MPYFCDMKIKVTYHIEVMGQTSHEGQTHYECTNFEEGIRKLKSLRSSEVHVHLIKTTEKGNKIEKYIVD